MPAANKLLFVLLLKKKTKHFLNIAEEIKKMIFWGVVIWKIEIPVLSRNNYDNFKM